MEIIMTGSGNMNFRIKLFASFAAISIVIGVFGCLGFKVLVLCSIFLGLAAGAIISNSISAQLKTISDIAEKTAAGEIDKANEIADNDGIADFAATVRKANDYQKDLAQALTQFAQGGFDVSVKPPRSERDIIGKALQLCINNGRMFEKEVLRISEAIKQGRLRERCKDDEFRGAYGNLVKNINLTLEALVRPPGKAMKVLTKVVEGDLSARYMDEAPGDYAAFRNSLNMTLKTLDDALARVGLAAERVSSASEQISAGSQTLSQKASEQASSIEEASSNLHEVAAMTKQNAINAKEARRLSQIAETSVEAGVASMMRLSDAINRIKTSSDSTAKIIKTIDEIAFQTNLLALNAAVEAARAGDAGKGFAVVAEEVRNLAMRSAEAAKNTANLIEESVKNSESGVALNQEVLKNLGDINSQVKEVGSVMAEIAESSEQQTHGVEQVNSVISQMNIVTQQVAANAEESASGAEELSGQAEELKSMVRAFRLSSNTVGGVRSFTAAPQKAPVQHAPLSLNAPNRSINSQTGAAKMIPLDDHLDSILKDF
jgi:methyl-accepting chemotaxis protein